MTTVSCGWLYCSIKTDAVQLSQAFLRFGYEIFRCSRTERNGRRLTRFRRPKRTLGSRSRSPSRRASFLHAGIFGDSLLPFLLHASLRFLRSSIQWVAPSKRWLLPSRATSGQLPLRRNFLRRVSFFPSLSPPAATDCSFPASDYPRSSDDGQ